MEPGNVKQMETALKQHWKGLKIKSNNYPALLRKNIPTKGQDYTIPELGTALLSYAKEKGVASWTELIKLNNNDPWSDLSKRTFNSEKYGNVLKKLAHLENAHFDSFLDEQLLQRREGGKQSKDKLTDRANNVNRSGPTHDAEAPKTKGDAPQHEPMRSPCDERARIPRAKKNPLGSNEGTTGPSAAGEDESAGRTSPAPDSASPDQPTRSHSRKQPRSEGDSAGGFSPSPASPAEDVLAAERRELDQGASTPNSAVKRTESKSPAPSSRREEGPSTARADRPHADQPSPRRSPSLSDREEPISGRPSYAGTFMDSPSKNTRSQTTPKHDAFGAGQKRPNEEGSAQPAKKGPGNPCPRPGGCPAQSINHIRRNTCEGCNYDIYGHNAARKKAAEEAKQEKIPALPVVLRAASREVANLHKLGCSASLMVQTPKTGKQATQWYFDSAGTKGKAFLDKHKGYFRKAMKTDGEGEIKVEEGANPSGKVDDATEQKTVKPAGAVPANLFMLSSDLENLVRGFADRYLETVIDTMLTALKKHYIDSNTAKALDMSALQSIFGKDMLGPCLRFLSSVKEL